MKSTFDSNILLKSISLFDGSGTWYEFKELLRSHPELLGNECDGLLEILINDTNEDDRDEVLSRKVFLELREIFSLSRKEGVEGTLAMTEQMYRDEIARIRNVIATLKLPEEMHDRSILCRKALYLMALLKLEKGRDWAAMQFELGESLAQIPGGNLPQNIEDAIVACKFALGAVNQKVDRHLWMAIMVSLGIAYRIRVEGDPADNIEKSIECYKAALEVTLAEETEQRAIILENLGIAYRNRIKGDPMKNIEDAISYLTKATATFGRGSIIWARAMMNLGNAYRNRLPHMNKDNLNSAIDAYNSALTVFDKEQMHLDLGKTWLNLGIAYSDLQDGEGYCKLKAIDAYTFAIKNFDRTFAEDLLGLAWMHLGTVYWERRDFDSSSIKKAISAYIEALDVLNPNSMPFFLGNNSDEPGGILQRRSHWRRGREKEKSHRRI